jgi:predicted outer membrane repeat protein
MKTIFIFLVFFLLSTVLYPTIINVPADQPTIQAGITAAADTDTVLVAEGTYFENIDFIGKTITVASNFLIDGDESHIENTIINGSQPINPDYGSCIMFISGENFNSVLNGFTITAGSGNYFQVGWFSVNLGGGIYCENSSPSLENVTITGNSATQGGGIRCTNSSPSLNNVTITDNSATGSQSPGGWGGGIHCSSNSSPSLVNVTITENSAYEGGGIHCISSSPSLVNVTISGNTAAACGGGIYCWESSPSLQNVTIVNNNAYSEYGASIGGGIYCRDNSSPSLQNVTISGNFADHSGGGIYCNDSSPSFDPADRCNIFLNYAGSGSDLYAYDCPTIDVIVDTFTVLQPDDYFACPIDNFTFDILNAKLEQVDQDLYVSPDGSNDNSGLTLDDPLRTVSYALAKIFPDSTNPLTIHLSNGTYSLSGTGEIFPLYCRSFVSLLGEDEISTILDGEGLSGILFCQNDNNFSIENVTIQNGNAYEGGGIYFYESSPSLQNVTISGNFADHSGGGIYCWYNSSPSLVNVVITGNTSNNGGGIYCIYNSSPSLVNVTVSNNNGGGIYCRSYSNPSLVNTTITENSAYNGGGIDCELNSSPSLVNVTISGNFADHSGGGIYCYNNSSPSLQNVTITGNSADDNGGGIFCFISANPSLVNSILWNNSPQEIYFTDYNNPNLITISYSDIQGGEAGIVTNDNGTVNWLEGNLDEDPLFVGTGGYPFSLLEDSPCIDAGNPDPIYYDPEDPGNPGYALYPAMGTIVNDMGTYGGPNAIGWPPVGLDDNIIVQTPEVFLHQNYPNPFNPSTTISFQLSEVNSQDDIELVIYNIKGQKVKVLTNSLTHQPTNRYSVTWDGRDDYNQPVSSGIYFYKLKTANFQKTKKMILLR